MAGSKQPSMSKTFVNQCSWKIAILGNRSLIITSSASLIEIIASNSPELSSSPTTQIVGCQNYHQVDQFDQFEECISAREVHFLNRNNFSRSCAYLYDLMWQLGRNCELCNWAKYLSLLTGWDPRSL